MAIIYTKPEFDAAYARLSRNAADFTLDTEALVLGAAQLFWEHNRNCGYIERAIKCARLYKGLRVNAVRKFLQDATGVRIPTGTFNHLSTKGAKITEAPAWLDELDSWLDYADENAPEPAYNEIAEIKSLMRTLRTKSDNARAAGKVSLSKDIDTFAESLQQRIDAA